jgi:hypothetical protein
LSRLHVTRTVKPRMAGRMSWRRCDKLPEPLLIIAGNRR